MRDPIASFVRDESGANTVEYSLLAALAAVGALVALEGFGVSMEKLLSWAGITLVVLLLTGSVAAGILWYSQGTETRCRWRRQSAIDRPPFKGWVCRRCGEEAYSRDKWWPPKECKSALRSAA